LAVRQEKADSEKEKRVRDAELRKAARLIDGDFRTAAMHLELTIVQEGIWAAGVREVSLQAWQDYRAVLAAHLDIDAYVTVMAAGRHIAYMEGMRGVLPAEQTDQERAKVLGACQTIAQHVANGIEALKPYVK